MEDMEAGVGWNSLPFEIASLILGFVTEGNSRAGIPLHFVCKQWHTILPPPLSERPAGFRPPVGGTRIAFASSMGQAKRMFLPLIFLLP